MSMLTANSEGPSLPSFATSDGHAKVRYDRWRSRDPFPDIDPALLNSADLLDYIATVGMLYPFEATVETLDKWVKPASCGVACTGDYLRWDLDRKTLDLTPEPTRGTLTPDTRLRLPANTITFLQLETVFRIPVYLAARFNLAIREIHRGILVGTGPLVDPGFEGRLLIPLHNLTINEYSILYGEPIVWVEFTKLSDNPSLKPGQQERRTASFIDFPKRKLKRKSPEAYLDHAYDGKPIASSIPREVARASAQAESAVTSVRNLRRIGTIGVIVALLATVWPVVSLISSTNSRVDQSAQQTAKVDQELKTLSQTVAMQAAQIRVLQSR